MRYDQVIANHYSAYRPPLHGPILKRAVSGLPRRPLGVDIGCGTGRSSVALTPFCDRVIGVDPSPAMLAEATPHPAVIYREGRAENLPCRDASADLATFAGCLAYVDRAATTAELRRVCRTDAVVLGYDFVVLLEDALQLLETQRPDPASPYDPRADLGDARGLILEDKHEAEVPLPISPTELAHVLLAEAGLLPELVIKYDDPDPLDELAAEIQWRRAHEHVAAALFFSRYRVL